MLEENFEKTIKAFTDIVETVESLEVVRKEGVERLKAKIRLFDGSMLWVREVWLGGILEVYSYYWLRSDQILIIGWDNAPHHKNVRTFPHHKHIGSEIEESQERNMEETLNFIKRFFE